MTNFEPDIGVNDPTDASLKPYMRLWAAVMRLGISDFCTARTRKDFKRTEPYRWFWDNHSRKPGKFLWLCELFDIDPDTARARVMKDWRKHVDRTARKEVAHG